MKRDLFYIFIIVAIAFFSTTLVPAQAAEGGNGNEVRLADVSQLWAIYTDEDSVSNVDLTWMKQWYFRIVNYTQEDIQNPKATVETPLELVWLYPPPTVTGPPIYEWTAGVVPGGSWFVAGGFENEYITDRPRISASRSVSPNRLADYVTVQTAVVTLKLEESLPPEVNEAGVTIGFYPISTPHPLTPTLVDYTLLTYENTSLTENKNWEVFLHGKSAVEWFTFSPDKVEIGKTYEFRATFQAVKSESLEGAPVSKPDVNVLWRKVENEPLETGTSVTIDYPYEDLTVTFQSDNPLQWSKIISSAYRYLHFSSFITPLVGTEPPFYSLENLRFTLHSNADLHVYDPAGRHVGLNYATGEEEIEILGATYERNADQVISIPEPTYENYSVVLVGTSTGPYELVIEGATETETFLTKSYSGEIETDETHETTVTVPKGVGELEISAPEVIPSAPAPAVFEVSHLSVTPAEVEAGKEVRVTVDVTNVGELAGNYALSLLVNGVVESSPTITLAGGETRKVVFRVVRDVAGTYNVEVGVLSSAFTVTTKAERYIGVEVGDWANYHATGYIPEPEWYILEVTDVSGNNVTIQVDMYYENGEKESLICTGDPIAGTGLLYNILAPGGLSPDDQFTIWLENEIGYAGPVTIIETIPRTYAGESREVNHVTIYGCDLYYDKETGIFCEGVYGSYYSVVMTETNMWGPISAVIPEPQSVTETNPITVDATETTNTIVNVTSISDSCAVTIENVAEAPSPPNGLEVIGNSILIDNSKPVTITAELRISYDPTELSTKGIAESSLTIHYWDGSAWVPEESHVNVEERYVWAEIDHFSYWALMGEIAPPAEEGVPIALILVPIVGAVVAVLVLLYFRLR